MEKFFEEYLAILERCHNNVLSTLGGLPEAALDWAPGPDMNSITVLIYHLTGAERFWVGDVVGQTPSGRDRDAEFKVSTLGLDALKNRLDESLGHVRSIVEQLSLQDLAETCVTPEGRTTTVTWALLHALEHSTLHLGHIEMTRQMWQARQGTR